MSQGYRRRGGGGGVGGGSVATTSSRQQAQMTATGYFAENYPRGTGSASSPMASGSIYFQAIGLNAGDVVTNIVASVVIAGSGFSGIGMKVGLYSKAGVKLAQSADVSASVFSATGARTAPLTAPYTVLTTDGFYVALLSIATTGPALLRTQQSLTVFGPFTGGTLATYGIQTGQTDLVTPATVATTASFGYWAGVS